METTIKVTTLSDHQKRGASWISTAHELYKIRQLKKELALQDKLLSDKLKALSENVSSKGGGYAFSCSVGKGRINYKEIEVLQTMDLEPYRGKASVIWKITKI